MSCSKTFIFLLFLFKTVTIHAQDCKSVINIKLENMSGGVFAGQKITLTTKTGSQSFTEITTTKGEARFSLPCNTLFDVTIPNYTRKMELQSEDANTESEQTLTYAADMVEKDKKIRMTATEQASLDAVAAGLPDTIFVKGANMESRTPSEYFSKLSLNITDFDGKPLADETVIITSKKRNRNIKTVTDHTGNIVAYLVKGDLYRINFIYDRNYSSTESAYTNGRSTIDMTVSYLGTKEIERRKKLEAERLAIEAKRIKEEKERFEKYRKELKLTKSEAYKKKLTEYVPSSPAEDTVILATLNRNRWTDKLIVCDLSGSMFDFSGQLALWYRLNFMKEKNLQFVFFNDGDSLPDDKKQIGKTGGIYFTKAKGVDSLNSFAAMVSAAGDGGDVAENNMEALIKGVKMAAPYKELVMIADNRSPVKDIELLSNFAAPVHIIVCGVTDKIHPDYLQIAWKTKGSIHTMKQDITVIANMLEGQQISIEGVAYRIMGGKFVYMP